MGLPPVVTGVSPKEGPPGTRVTIRGENLGYGPDDITGINTWSFFKIIFNNLLYSLRADNLWV